jgi:hypothetical protein
MVALFLCELIDNQSISPMEQTSTPLKKRKNVRRLSPRKFIIDNLLNYSRSLTVIGGTMVLLNN